MTVFAEKLDGLSDTIACAAAADPTPFSRALREAGARPIYAVGSGGSAIVAEYLARCRQTLQAGPTVVLTPLQFVLGEQELSTSDIWLFSASGSNPDILAAFEAARARQARCIRVVSTTEETPLGRLAQGDPVGSVLVAPTGASRDGFLATHSLLSAVTVLLAASDLCAPQPLGAAIVKDFSHSSSALLAAESRAELTRRFASVRRSDTLFLLQDPRLDAAALLIETSAWEAGICAVQRTDFRNFAHGRHVWLAHRTLSTFIVALTAVETRSVWEDLGKALPPEIRTEALDFGGGGRAECALSLVQGLTVVEALGLAAGIDPGRPRAGNFAEALYESPSLLKLSRQLTPSVRSKAEAARLRDDPDVRNLDMAAGAAAFRSKLATSRFTGLVLDYDGTLVTEAGKFEPMAIELAAELERLLDEGLALAVATGRGGSSGADLRKVLPERHWQHVQVSYYNGAWTQPLAIDLDLDPAPRDPRIDGAREWLLSTEPFCGQPNYRNSPLQLSVDVAELADPDALVRKFVAECDLLGGLRLVRSSHTVDICLVEACKTRVAQLLADRTQASLDSILCIGDSGAYNGNDYALLGLPRAISVGRVCDRPTAAWSLFGSILEGPDALLRVLQALGPDRNGAHRLELDSLGAVDV